MELEFSEDDRRFSQEVMSFLKESVSSPVRAKLLGGYKLTREELRAWHDVLDSQGWAVPHWPVEWGGTGWSPVRQYLFRECLHLAPAPEPHVQNVNLIGPLIAQFGSEQMKARFLPGIRTLELYFCQGFSEPNAGSDLASLRTRAVREGNYYIVNGQKTWTTGAHLADWMFCLVRTNANAKKHEGISYLLIDMKSPGVTVRPILTNDGQHHLNEVFLDNVRVPADQLVGEENKGWAYSRFLLAQERLTIARVGVCKRNILLAKQAFQTRPHVAQAYSRRLAELEVQLKALEVLNLRALSASGNNQGVPNEHIPSILKLRGAELQQATSELLLDMAGPNAWARRIPTELKQMQPAHDDDIALTDAATNYLHLRAASIYGGSNEIQRNLVARTLIGRI